MGTAKATQLAAGTKPVRLRHSCSPTTFAPSAYAKCKASAENLSTSAATISLQGTVDRPRIVDIRHEFASGSGASGRLDLPANGFSWDGVLDAAAPPTVDSIEPGSTPAGGYLPLSAFGVPPIAGMGDETIQNFNVTPFKWIGQTYSVIGVDSNGYVVIGGGTAADNVFNPQTLPDPTAPNNVIAPYWTDLNPGSTACTGTCGVRIGELTDGSDTWIVVDWADMPRFSNSSNLNSFEIWLGVAGDSNPAEDVSMAYGTLGSVSDATATGAEDAAGVSGVNVASLPTTNAELRVNTSPGSPGGKVTVKYRAVGLKSGDALTTASLASDLSTKTLLKSITLHVAAP